MNNVDIRSKLNELTVSWTTPSIDSSGSMPLGNGDVAANVWAEANGDLVFYISKSDAWDDAGRLVKIGRVRVHLGQTAWGGEASSTFLQRLNLHDGCIEITAGEGTTSRRITMWIDANAPIVHVDITGQAAFDVSADVELWRTETRSLSEVEDNCAIGTRSAADRSIVGPDTILRGESSAAVWYHRNEHSCWSATLDHQHLGQLKATLTDPLMHRTFGAWMAGDGFASKNNGTTLASIASKKHHRIDIAVHTAQAADIDAFISQLRSLAHDAARRPIDVAHREHLAHWHAFWDRSYIFVDGDSDAFVVSRGYALQRFIIACAGRGRSPIKFNGSLFTVDAEIDGERVNADYRRWGGGYWFQNTRLTYWPMLASGDVEMMMPLFKMYLDALPLATGRVRAYYGHRGANYPETMTFWTTYLNGNYGFDRGDLEIGITENRYIRHYWLGMLELIEMMLCLHRQIDNDAFARDTLLPLARPMLEFYYDHFPKRDDNGKIVFHPSQALETWHDAVNPLPDIVGLEWVMRELLALPQSLTSVDDRAFWTKYISELPPVPTRSYFRSPIVELIPAMQYDNYENSENVQLYAVFPFRRYVLGAGDENLAIGRRAFEHRDIKCSEGWRQDAIQAAYLGLSDQARADVVKNFSTSHAGSRFPAFWGPNFDWVPDQDHGSVATLALQTMMMQAVGDDIQLLAAWPRSWNATFKLHGPRNTIVEGEVNQGELKHLNVTPGSRRNDVRLATLPSSL